MSEPAHAAVSDLDDARARKEKAHRWTRWNRQLVKQEWLPRSKTLRHLIDKLVERADNETGEWELYLAELAAAMGASERTVQRRMGDLVTLGVIEYRPGRSNPKTKSWFRLIPLEERETESRPTSDAVSPQGGQDDAPGEPEGLPTGATVSPLTAVATANSTASGTTTTTELARPRASVKRAAGFPERPAGRGQRETGEWLDWGVREWASSERLPVAEHWTEIQKAALMGRSDRQAFVDYLERVTDWRYKPSAPGQLELEL